MSIFSNHEISFGHAEFEEQVGHPNACGMYE